ncbi:MAG TPA: G1 family glutamic endopeptidase [Nitrososphaerales archaeon]|nr:G1 family glutamic endopeptidase [Nitrososphaerales archaeon]
MRLSRVLRTAAVLGLLLLVQPSLVLGASSPAVQLIHPPIIRYSSSESTNWSGYAVTGATGSVSEVWGSWVVPSVAGTCTSSNQYSSFWVGIDGFTSSTVEQTGTDSDCQGGSPTYYAWYEFYPAPSFVISGVNVHPGDKMGALVKYAGGSFTVGIEDFADKQYFTTSAAVPSALRTSAEWIAEAPSSFSGVLPLADFGTADFGLDYTGIATTSYADVGGTVAPIGSFGASVQSINMVNTSGVVIAQTSALSSDGTSFTVQRITGTAPRSTTTAVAPGTTSETVGDFSPVTFTATVTDTGPGTPSAPTGNVAWSDGGKGGTFNSASCTLSPFTSGSSTCTVTYSLSPSSLAGSVTIAASYSGDSSHGQSSGSGSITVNLRSTSTGVTPGTLSVPQGTPITSTATVTDTSAGTASSPTGTVTWKVSGLSVTVSCTLKASGPGVSSCSVSGILPPGSYTVTATYNGDSVHGTSFGTSSISVA